MTGRIDVYPVGWLAILQRSRRAYLRRGAPAEARTYARAQIKWEIKRNVHHIRDRNWRALKNTFNGYMAEPTPWPDGIGLTRCGSGWTKARALRSLRRHGYREEML
jgi:hypothetical protein